MVPLYSAVWLNALSRLGQEMLGPVEIQVIVFSSTRICRSQVLIVNSQYIN